MKHLVLTLLGLLSFCLAIRAEVYSGECGDNGNNLTWTLDTETGKLVISGNGAMTQNPWRDYRNYIRIVDIQEGVTSIVSDAFADCSNLTNVIIAESVTTINYYAFYNCKSLNNITIPDNVTYIGSSAFQGCTNLSNITIACTTIASYAFQECTNLKKVTIKNGVKEIKKGAFDNCTSIEKVIVEDGEETLTLGAGGGYNKGLFHNSPIKNLYIGRNLEYNTTSDYGYSPFYALRTIVSLNIGSQVSLLKDNAFNNCTNLNSITCQNSNPPICGTNTFTSVITSTCKLSVPKSSVNTYKSTNPWSDFKNIVESKVISGTCGTNLTWELTSMGELIIKGKGDMNNFMDYNTPWFDYRTSIEKISIGEGVTSIGNWAFYNCNNIESIDFSKDLTHIGNYAFRNCALISTVSLPEKLSSIGDGAFDGCINLSYFSIPNNVTHIGASAFGNTAWYNDQPDGTLYIGRALYEYKGYAPWDTSINITEGTKFICPYALNGCDGITSIVIPNSITTIGEHAFHGCRNLTSISCDAETPPVCGNSSFEYIDKSIPVYVPASSVSIYKNADLWKDFENIQRNDIVASGSSDNSDFTWLLTNSGELIVEGTGSFRGCPGSEHITSIIKITICNGISALGDWAFSDYKNVTSVSLPSSISRISKGAFYECKKLSSVTIENGLLDIGESAFYQCVSLKEILLPNSVTNIGSFAFNGCTNLASINIPSSMTTIGNYTFYNCSALNNISIPNGIKSIGTQAFASCTNLKELILPSSVNNIGTGAFYDCTSLSYIICNAGNPPTCEATAFSYVPTATCELMVPAYTVNAYTTTSPWSTFTNIEALPLTDGEDFENTEEQELKTFTYTRTLPNLYWNALYVPFEIPVSEIIDKYEVAYVNNINSYDHNDDGTIDDMRMEVIKIKSGTLNANYPYLIKARNDEARSMNLTLENTTLFQSVETTIDCSSVFAKHEITGIYNKRYKNELPEGAMAISMAGAWQPIASGSYLNPFRLYMTITARDGSPVKVEPAAMSRIRISVLGEDVETDIEETRSETKNIILDLSGRSVQNPVKGGVYIVNGKKVIF